MLNTTEIHEQYGKNSKIAFISRHGKKTEDGNHITIECLKNIIENGIPSAPKGINLIHLGSYFIRTEETVLALALWVMSNGGKIEAYINRDERLGNEEIFDLYDSGTRAIIAEKKLSNYEAMEQLHPDQLRSWNKELKSFVTELFEFMEPGDICAVPCHTPTVECLFNLFAADEEKDSKMNVPELGGICLIQTADGAVHAIR